MTITSGTILYGRTIKTGDYESARSDVTLTFSVPEDADEQATTAYIQSIGQQAQQHCYELLKLRPAQTNVSLKESNPPLKAARGKPKATAPTPLEAAIGEAPGTGPAQIDEPTPAPIEDPAAVNDDFTPIAAEITDEQLIGAMTKTNARIRNPIAIRQLIGKYVEIPKQARDIPQPERKAFLLELDKLQAPTS